MKRNFTNINKTHNYISPQLIEHIKKDRDMQCWKSRHCLGSGTKMLNMFYIIKKNTI